ncbi:MAG: hybrid sensor histidine kinase/response regulator [Cyanobacteria bacterium J06639_14]
MSDAKELEIKRQFLDEAQEYLGTLEAALLGIAHGQVDTEKINGALRAAHSIKGGAGMMGYSELNRLAHKLEDSFKVLKIQRQQLDMDSELERLLLSAVDCLRQVITWNRQGTPVDHAWLEGHAKPIFGQLHDRLGDPQEENAASMLSPEEGQDIIPMLFETEVEGCLQRLESILADPAQPCLSEEVAILAQELEGLGEMLQLPAFSSLCRSIAEELAKAPDEYATISQQAIAAWRRSQALVLTGQLALLPTALTDDIPLETLVTGVTGAAADELTAAAITESAVTGAAASEVEPHQVTQDGDQPVTAVGNNEENASMPAVTPPGGNFKPVAVPVNDTVLQDEQDTTVRVSVKRLNTLNDLMGELTIERNSLTLNLGRLRELLGMLKDRIQTLDKANSELRSSYDKVAIGQVALDLPVLASVPQTGNLITGNADNSSPPTSPPPARDNGFDALEMDRYSDLHLISQEMMETIVQLQEVTSDIELELEETEQTGRNFNKTGKQLQNGLTHVRMRPISDVLERFPRALRDLCLQHGKEAELKVLGGNTLIDRNILENLTDPLMHLLRNAFDHGLEDPDTRNTGGKTRKGLIEISAAHRSNRTVVTIRDDGRGIDLTKIRHRAEQMGLDAELLATATEQELLSLIFEPGFSTSTQVTDLSGRGVGMDVVRNNLKEVRGDINVNTELGQGTTFTLSVPFTLSVARILLVESQHMALAFPTDAMAEILVLAPEEAEAALQKQNFQWGDRRIPLVRLANSFTFNGPRPTQNLDKTPAIDTVTIMVVNHGDQYVGLQVERCWGEQEVAIRRVEGDLPLPPGFSSCTILGDGRVVPLVSVPEILQWIATTQQSPEDTPNMPARLAYQLNDSSNRKPGNLPGRSSSTRQTLLIVDDSINVRRFLALTLEKAGYRVEQARDGQDAINQLQDGLRPNAIICDIEMPRLDGYGFLAKAKANAELEPIPVIMLTSRSGQKHRQLAMNLGANAYFSKPYNEHVLLQTLEQLVNAAA